MDFPENAAMTKPVEPPENPAGKYPRRSEPAHLRRLNLLHASFDGWLATCQLAATTQQQCLRAVGPAIDAWPPAKTMALADDFLPGYTRLLAESLNGLDLPQQPTLATVTAAFARSLVALAATEVEREARRAGHDDIFQALRPFLEQQLANDDTARLCVKTGLGTAALNKALARLRLRFRQRIDSGLALWSSPSTRADLRRRLHAALIYKETTA